MKKVFIATGGTGGHIIPARCLAQELSKNNMKVFVLADAKYRGYIKEQDQFSSIIISASQIVKTLPSLIKAAIKISFGLLQSLYYFILFRPNFVVSFGGYATFPILIAALFTRTRIILHEQNAHLGKVNRIFASRAFRIALTFEQTSGIKKEDIAKLVITGNPVREEIIKLHEEIYKLPIKTEIPKRDKMGYNVLLTSELNDYLSPQQTESFNVLIIGGSGGAKIFSDILPQSFFNLTEELKNNLHVSQQCRQDLLRYTFDQYKKFNIDIKVAAFFENMAEEIKAAHLIIARSGSSSIAEFCVAKKPMILIPFARAADDHQMKNAQIVEKCGAAGVIYEKKFTIKKKRKVI